MATTLTGEDGLELQEGPPAECGSNQVRIRNRALALNFPDCLITRGEYQLRLDPPFVPGSECSGDVLEVGADVAGIRVGDRVLSLCGVGAFSEQIVVTPPIQQVHVIPDEMSYGEAAAFAMTYGTALHALRRRARLIPGETALVLGSAGGCGSAAVAVAAAMGARVIAGASSAERCTLARGAGAHETVDYGAGNLRDRVMELTDGRGVDVIFDPVGGALFDEAKRCVGWNGRYLVVGFAGGDIPVLAANYTILKSMALVGVAYGMSAIHDPATNDADFQQLFSWYAEGRVRPHLGRVTGFNRLPHACAELYAGQALGKTVIEI